MEVFIMKAKEIMGKMDFYVLSLAFILLVSQAVLGGDLKITPVDDFESSGQAGGPFSPSSKDYELTNNGTNLLYWGAMKTVDWLDLDSEFGLLDPCESTIVTVSLTSDANSLGGGIYTDTITFVDITNNEEQTREAILTISAIPGVLDVTPVEGFEPSGEMGGPFIPSSKDYQLTNSGGSFIYWGASKTADWLDLDSEFGLLDPFESTVVTVSLTTEANSLGTGIYTDTLTFTDLTNAQEQTRGVTITINVPPVWINPRNFDVNTIEGLSLTEILTIGNNMSEDLNFMIRTRQVAAPETSGGKIYSGTTAGNNGIFSLPLDHNFTLVGEAPYKPGELIVRFAAKTDGRISSMTERNQLLSSIGGGTIKYDFKIVPGLSVVELPAPTTVEDALLALNGTDGILYAQPNYEVEALSTFPDDPRFDELWGMHNTGQTGGTFDADIDAPEAWDIATGTSEAVVAVIDTGVDYTHVDLAANMWINEAEFNGSPGVDDDNNGYVDDIYGYDFCNNDGDPMDDHYHGTHCAGTIGAVGNNSEGVAGVCWNVKIMAIKFLNSGGRGWTDDAIKCVQYSTLMGANLSSNSWGGGGYSQGLKDAIDAAGAAGMLFLASAGNNGANNDVSPHYPSSYDSQSLIAVMATDSDDRRSDHGGWASNYGPQSVDIGAPGSSILSCEPWGQYGIHSGTSMATPHVAGACALLWSTNQVMSNNEVKDIVLRTVDKTLEGLCVSEGRLNLYKAVLETSAPWIKIEPEAGTIIPGQSSDISITFDTMQLAPGTYQAEIVIISNEPGSPRFVPVTMIVKADDLQVSPLEGFESIGTEGGPFEPQSTVYTLTNIGTGPVNWTTFETENWLQVLPYEGILDPNETIDVNVCISAEANSLDPNIYIHMLTFQNVDSGSIKPRSISLTVKPPDCFTESFSNTDSDLDGLMLTFSPDGSVAYYEACRDRVDQFPEDPNGGAYVPLWDDDFAEIVLSDANVLFYGKWYDRFYIGSNGYITFGQGDTQFDPSLEHHFDIPRISGLFADLNPPNDECISYKLLDDKVTVTFQNVPLWEDKDATISLQIEMFFVDGAIRITWLDTAPTASVVGLSRGRGLPPIFFEQSNLNGYSPCWPLGDFNRDYYVNKKDLAIFVRNWLCADCNIPYWCEKTDLNFSRIVEMSDFAFFADNWMTKLDWWLLPVSHWKFDEGEGAIAYDSAGSNDGTVYGATWITGQINGALSFDGVDDYVEVIDSNDTLDIEDSITIAAWVKLNDLSDVYFIVTKQPTGTSRTNYPGNYVFRTTPLYGYLQLYYQTGTGDHEISKNTSTSGIGVGAWNHAAVTLVQDGNINFYINGSPAGTVPQEGVFGLINDEPIRIGTRKDAWSYFNGNIDDVRIYQRALSDEEIQEIVRTGMGNKAFAPYPADGAINVDPNVVLSWTSGKDTISHDVYFGTDYYDVNDANTLSDEYKGNYDVNSFDPCGLDLETTYYWRIDEVTNSNTYKGDVWSFTTRSELIPGCVGWWKFDEGSGTIAYDSAGTNHGDVLGATWTTGQINGALSFDGVDDYVNVIDTDDSLDIEDSLTIAAWVKLNDLSEIYFIVTKQPTGTSRTNYPGNYVFRTTPSDGYLQLYYQTGTGDNQISKHTSTSGIGAGAWNYVSVTLVEGGNVSFYIDGSPAGTVPQVGVFGLINDEPVRIGTRKDGWSYFDGIIDDVKIFNIALSASEIQQLCQNMYLAGP
jgi:subtilisin family serine protease